MKSLYSYVKDAVAFIGLAGVIAGIYIAADHFSTKVDKVIHSQSQIISTMKEISDKEESRDKDFKEFESDWFVEDKVWNEKQINMLDELRNDLKDAREKATAQRKEQTTILQELKFK